MTTEHRYLVELARAYFRDSGEVAPPPDGIHWEDLKSLLLRHRLIPTLAPVLETAPFPSEVKEDLLSVNRNFRLRTALLLLELRRLLPALEAIGARPLVLKGPALTETVYRRGARFFSDLDILVDPDLVEESCSQLASFGYKTAESERHSEFWERYHFHRVLYGSSAVTLEIHWDLARPRDYFGFDVKGIWSRSRLIELDSQPVRIPSDADQLMHAAAQSLREGFADVRRVFDAALLLEAGADEDPGLEERARRQSLSTAIWILVGLANRILGVRSSGGLEKVFHPGSLRAACVNGLDLEARLLALNARKNIKPLLSWLCAPESRTTLAEIVRFLFPGRDYFLDQKLAPEEIPGAPGRVLFAARRSLSLARLGGHQMWGLARQRTWDA